MSATPEERIENAVTYGRAIVRIIEAADVLLDREPAWTERLLLKLVWKLYTHKLRGLVAVLLAGLHIATAYAIMWTLGELSL